MIRNQQEFCFSKQPRRYDTIMNKIISKQNARAYSFFYFTTFSVICLSILAGLHVCEQFARAVDKLAERSARNERYIDGARRTQISFALDLD